MERPRLAAGNESDCKNTPARGSTEAIPNLRDARSFASATAAELPRKPDGLDAQEHERVLAGAERGIGDDKGNSGSVRIVVGGGGTDTEFSWQRVIPFV